MAADAVTPSYPMMMFEEGDNRVSGSVLLHRVSGTVPPLELPSELARPHVERPAEWEGLVHRQMYRYVRGKIEANIYAIGDGLPTPEQLAWHFGTTSSQSARRAYAELATEGLVTGHGEGPYVVAARTPPPVQTVEGAVARLDALEESVNETLVALRRLRGELAGVQTPCCGQWWLVRSLAGGADPAVEILHAVCIRDGESGELQWLACISNTWVRKPLSYFQPLRHLSYINNWTCDNNDDGEPGGGTQLDSPPQPEVAAAPASATGVAYYSREPQQAVDADYELYGPEQWEEGFFQ
ncbi:GntR family transcriptional regulator [Mycobacteroides abscessus]|nr:GntR family transcriptional regulator [Mycobacteroides abscessus]MDM2176021.1 GntR family transcriptional regulator [Mycobacteroides abscessus]MDM2207081.1 GntR family transcriptional regulator [Mycobacteroides abscessus]MDM2210175.1 GntR family transcriptional regulator [Mycobacteroides abscessus]MDM2217357.1 GntR family transcriptional regulator [Mycobacteroides abscessus]